MPRSGTGTYTLPSGNPVVTGTTIETSWANTTLSDIATAMSDSLSRSGQGGMTAAFRGADGTSGAPGISFTNETTTGFYRVGSADLRLAVTTNLIQQWLTTGTNVTGTLSATGDFAINTNKFNVTAASGNTAIAGTVTLSALTASKVVFTDASKVLSSTGTVGIDQGGTGATTDSAARTNLGATTVGANFFTLANPSAITFIRVNADNSVSALNAADFRTAIGAGSGTGDVTGPASAVSGNVASFNGTTGKIIQDSGKALPTGSIVGTTDTQTLFGKTFSSGTYFAATVTGNDSNLTRVCLLDTSWEWHDNGTSNAINYENGSAQRWAPNTGSQTLTISNWPGTGTMGELLIEGVNLGAATITWPAAINWIKSDGTTTTTFANNGVTLQTSGTDWVFLWTRDAGTTIYGKVVR